MSEHYDWLAEVKARYGFDPDSNVDRLIRIAEAVFGEADALENRGHKSVLTFKSADRAKKLRGL